MLFSSNQNLDDMVKSLREEVTRFKDAAEYVSRISTHVVTSFLIEWMNEPTNRQTNGETLEYYSFLCFYYHLLDEV